MMTKSFIFPQLLSYTGSFKCSPGRFFAGANPADKLPVAVEEETVRGVIANYGADKSAKNLGRPNLQIIDRACLPHGYDTCRVEFSLTVLPNALQPHACNDKRAREQLMKLVSRYIEKGGMRFLGERYLDKVLRDDWLWRNKTLTRQIDLTIEDKDAADGSGLFQFRLIRQDDGTEQLTCLAGEQATLIERFADALAGRRLRTILDISAVFHVGQGQEVFPSQELVRKNESRTTEGHDKSKTLASVEFNGVRQAVLHSQKIGNAIRTIDTWYNGYEEGFPLAVEPFGVDGGLQVAHRADNQTNFYSLLEDHYQTFMDALQGVSSAAELPKSVHNLHFVIACLIRGGVYSNEKTKNEKAEAA